MGTPFLSELRIMSFSYAPKGWAQCNGQLLPINQNQALFSLLGTTFGGNGQTTFGLPDLRGRVPIHQSSGFIMGQKGGEEFHTVIQSEMPAHNHFVNATSVAATASNPSDTRLLSQSIQSALYANASNFATMDPQAISNVGGSQPHENRQPFLVLNFCIALQGVFPSRN
jgi:microcystin-dependent protein